MKLIDTSLINEESFPEGVKIAVISINCALNADINIREIWDKFPLNDEIRTIKFKTQIKSTDNNLIEKEKKKLEKKLKQKKEVKSTKKRFKGDNFYNCIIIVVNISPTKIINIKLFNNGSIQMTGSKNLNQTEKALNIIIKYLKMKCYDTIDKKKVLVPFLLIPMSKSELKLFKKKYPDDEERRIVRNTQRLDLRKLKLFNFNINMINTSFSLNFKIHLGELNKILEQKNDCIVTYEASIHAGINIKIDRCSDKEKEELKKKINSIKLDNEKCNLTIKSIKEKNDKLSKSELEDIKNLENVITNNKKKLLKYQEYIEKKATILVFQSNDPKKMCNLIITGVTRVEHIIKAHSYITNIINDVKMDIIKVDVEEFMQRELIRLEEEEKILSNDLSFNDDDYDSSESSVSSNNLFIKLNTSV